MVTETWSTADAAWQQQAEAASNGYTTELEEYRTAHPRPTLGRTMADLAGQREEEPI